MASSSTRRTLKYNVFPSFGGQDVRKTFLSHLLEKLRRKLIVTFIDNNIERGWEIGSELLTAIKESEIYIVIFSKSYASSTWCLNELVEILKCCEDLDLGQRVVPVFYEVDPSHVRKQTGEFGDAFTKTCEGKNEDEKQRWIKALTGVANIAGYDFQNWDSEAEMTEQISKYVSNKLFTRTINGFGDLVGIDAHIESMISKFCLETEEVKIVGIVGTSGIGKTTIARALFNRLSSNIQHRSFRAYERTIKDDIGMKLAWEEQLLSDILDQKDIKLEQIGAVKERLKNKKVLIVLDDVNDRELLKTLVGEPGWFGNGSRIIVTSQDRQLVESHKVDLVYEVEYPSDDTALKMLCRSAFGENSPPDGFKELAMEVAALVGNLPLGLTVLGSSLRGRAKEEWVEMIPLLGNDWKGEIGKILKVCYDRLDSKYDQELFLYIACLFNGESVTYIKNLLEDVYTSVTTRLQMLVDKSLIRITTPEETVQMHTLLHKLGREIVRQESINDPGKRRFLVDLEDIREVLTNKTGTENVLGICLNQSNIDINEPLTIDENSFEGMRNLQFIKFYVTDRRCLFTGLLDRLIVSGFESLYPKPDVILKSHRGLVYFPPKLRLLHWDKYPWEYIPSNFKADYLVELVMTRSKLKRLWKGTLPLQHLKTMDLYWSRDLKKIPNLSKAKNLKVLNLLDCQEVMVLPKEVNFESLEHLHLTQCSWLKSFPRRRTLKAFLLIENIHRLTHLSWERCGLRCMPSNFRTEHLVELHMPESKFEKLWEGVQPLENLVSMNMSSCKDLKEFPNLSKATKLKKLDMRRCESLEVLPTDVNLESLEELNLAGCIRLRRFPQISTSITDLDLWDAGIEEVPCWIENMSNLEQLSLKDCYRLKNISASIFKLRHLKEADISGCTELTSFSDASLVVTDLPSDNLKYFEFHYCWSLDGKAQELILGLSLPMLTVLPGRQVPTYFTHRTSSGNSLVITLPQSSPSHQVLRFKAACIVVESEYWNSSTLEVHWRFRGSNGVKLFDLEFWANSDHFVVFNFELADFELISHLRSAAIEHKSRQCDMEFEFLLINDEKEKCEIKECGIRLLDAESGRSKKQMQMTETTSEESSNSLNGQIIADKELAPPNLVLSLEHEAFAQVSSPSDKIMSSSVSITNSFHGDDGASSST